MEGFAKSIRGSDAGQHASELLLGDVPQPLVAEGRDLTLQLLVKPPALQAVMT